jgi:hypothetical protein
VPKYPEVEDAHVVPAGYLRGFANGQMTMCHEVETGRSKERSVKSVGTRPRAYSRSRPDGSRIDDVEWSLSVLEDKVGILREAEERFPFSREDRNVIAQFAALQHVRGPAWAKWHDDGLQEFVANAPEMALPQFDGILCDIVAPRIKAAAEAMQGDTDRLMLMLRSMHRMMVVFTAMHWTLIRFKSPLFMTSDHPIVVWSGADEARSPGTPTKPMPVLQALEIRYPLTPRVCLLMTWAEDPEPKMLTEGKRRNAKNINAFTRAQAEEQWFHLPGAKPPFAGEDERLLPISTELYPGYGPGTIERSAHRSLAEDFVRQVRADPLEKNPGFPAIFREETA